MDNNIYSKKVKLATDKILDCEKIEGEGAVIVDEGNDKIHFLNSTALMVYNEIKGDSITNVYCRYKNIILQQYLITDESVIKESFEDLLVMLIENGIIVLDE